MVLKPQQSPQGFHSGEKLSAGHQGMTSLTPDFILALVCSGWMDSIAKLKSGLHNFSGPCEPLTLSSFMLCVLPKEEFPVFKEFTFLCETPSLPQSLSVPKLPSFWDFSTKWNSVLSECWFQQLECGDDSVGCLPVCYDNFRSVYCNTAFWKI